jgi:sialate O-acetylesterase
MAVTTDVGDADNIHPTKKIRVGERLALAARAIAYGERIEYSGPVFASMSVTSNRAVIAFTHLGGGLVAQGGSLKGFTVAGQDGNFFEASAVIEGPTVVVTSEKVSRPVAVRYGWSNVPDVNLFNQEGLPAVPFRTDAK